MITLKKCYAAHTDMNNNINTTLLIDEPRIVWIFPKLLTGYGTVDKFTSDVEYCNDGAPSYGKGAFQFWC